MNFRTSNDVINTIDAGRQVELVRSRNRALVDKLANENPR